jgi:BlaI family penicillinase repressor
MPRPGSTQPTDVELQILQVVWQDGPSTARQIHDVLSKTRAANYSTTVKMLSIMLNKDLLKRDEATSPHLYRPTRNQQVTQRRMLRDLIEKAYLGSAGSLVLQALSSKRASVEELAEIRRVLDELERKKP